MGWKILVFLAFILAHAVNAFHTEKLLKLSRIPKIIDLDAVEELMVDELTHEMASDLSTDIEPESKDPKDSYKSDMEVAESQAVWAPADADSSSVEDDPIENDALNSRDSYTNPHKRDDYYEGLEKKSQRSTYVPPARKTFYASSEVRDDSASIEFIPEPRSDGKMSSRTADSEDYSPKEDDLGDVLGSEAHHQVDSLDVAPSRDIYHSRPMQTPPWRYSKGKSYPRKQSPPVITDERSKAPEVSFKVQHRKTTSPVSHGTFRMTSPSKPRRPSPSYATDIHHHDESKFKSLTHSKPWVTEYTNGPIPSKAAIHEEREFFSQSKPWVTEYTNRPIPSKAAIHEEREFFTQSKPAVRKYRKPYIAPKVTSEEDRETFSQSKPFVQKYPKPHIPSKITSEEDREYFSQSKPFVSKYAKPYTAPKLAGGESRIHYPSSDKGRGVRQQFHEQGIRGPHSYKFGYNTGDVNNPMARYEEKDSEGIVRGSYSYIDARGHKQVVHYESHPKLGFKTKLTSDIAY